ncbi:hypothetical protein [Macrococcoides canis]|uniref:hypothetical protein n=1 Tax=Macrococcoides canis TaxID=1855823 RepID=UPI00165D8B11|nr:hypothetical protein [Macrococcus canis]QNR08271.1 hypothetical protein GL258_08360 [Macrococcus canis]
MAKNKEVYYDENGNPVQVKKKRNPFLMGCLGVFVFIMLLGSCSAIFGENKDKENEHNQPTTDTKKQEDKKVVSKEKDETTEKQPEKQPENHNEEYKLFRKNINSHISKFDEVWDKNWVASFNGISDGSVDRFTAYENMNNLINENRLLIDQFESLETPEYFNKNEEKDFEDFKRNMVDSLLLRNSAAEKAMKMFDSGEMSPSTVSDTKSIMNSSNNSMQMGIASLTSIDLNYNYDYSKEKNK